MNLLEYNRTIIDKMQKREEERPRLVEWAERKEETVREIMSDIPYAVILEALKSRDAWRDLATQTSERIERVYEDETGQPPEPEEPDTDRQREARAINDENRRAHG